MYTRVMLAPSLYTCVRNVSLAPCQGRQATRPPSSLPSFVFTWLSSCACVRLHSGSLTCSPFFLIGPYCLPVCVRAMPSLSSFTSVRYVSISPCHAVCLLLQSPRPLSCSPRPAFVYLVRSPARTSLLASRHSSFCTLTVTSFYRHFFPRCGSFATSRHRGRLFTPELGSVWLVY